MMKVDAEWWMDEQRVPFVDLILGTQRTTITRANARYLAGALGGCLNGIVHELCTWLVLDGWGKKHHLARKEVFRSDLRLQARQ
jgi:hypothetical protein